MKASGFAGGWFSMEPDEIRAQVLQFDLASALWMATKPWATKLSPEEIEEAVAFLLLSIRTD